METDFAERMEKRRAAREEARRRERIQTEAAAKEGIALSKSEKDRAHRLALAKRSVSREAVVVPKFDKAYSNIPLLDHGEDGEVNQAEAWWNSTMRKPIDPSTQPKTMWKDGDATPREDVKNLISKYKGKEVPAGYRGIWDPVPEESRLEQDIDRKAEKFVKGITVHKQETEAEKKAKQAAYDAMTLIEQRKFDRAASAASKKSAQEEAELEAQLDAEEEARLDQLEMQSYEDMMSEFQEYEKLKLGRSNECEGTSRARPSPAQDPVACFKWGERLKGTSQALKHSDAEYRARAAMRFADMTEFLREEEAAEALELGVMEPLMNVWEESYDHTKRDNVWGWLQATKEGSPEKMDRHTHIIAISFCRVLRNLTCALLNNFNLQPVAGRQQPGTIAYPWITRPSCFLDILMLQPGVFDLLCRHLSHPRDECKEHAAYALKNLAFYEVSFKQMILDAKTIHYSLDTEKAVLEVLRLNLASSQFSVQGSTAELLCSLLYSDQARAQSLAAGIVWDLCVKCRRDWKAQSQAGGLKPKTIAQTKRSKGRKTTIEEASEMLGDGRMVDFVKQDICREPGLIKGLTHLLNNGAPAARVTAAGAVWALCVERGNKRFLAQDHDLLKALAALINDIEGPEKAVMYASSALRNLATDLWVMDCMAAADKELIKVLLRKCEISGWQHAIVSPAMDAL